MIIFISRVLTLISTVIVGLLCWLPIYLALAGLAAYLIPGVDQLWREHGSQDVFVVLYAVSYLLTILVIFETPFVRDAYLDIVFGNRLLSDREKQSAQVLEDELRKRCKEHGIRCPRNIVWRAQDTNVVNGYAYGRGRISLPQKMWIIMREGSSDWRGGTLGIAAHELGHIYYGDGFFNSLIFVLLWPNTLLISLVRPLSGIGVSFLALRLIVPIGFIFTLINNVLVLMRDIAVLPEKMSSRLMEYRADHFTYRLGLAKEQVFVLDNFLRTENRNIKGWGWFVASHPPTEFRIQKLTRLIEQDRINKRKQLPAE